MIVMYVERQLTPPFYLFLTE